jgi:hypothetical protein
VQVGNVIINYGSANATQAGTTVNFSKAYNDNPPIVTLGRGYSGATGAFITATAITQFVLYSSTGAAGLVYYHAIGT